jgi:hypothetical protein
MQRALLGMIYPEIRAISVGFDGTRKFIINCYLDREPNEDDYENISHVTAEVLADIHFIEVEENCIFSLEPISRLNHLTAWVYVKKE